MTSRITSRFPRRKANAFQIKYVRIIGLFLSTLGAWTVDETGQKLHWLLNMYKHFLPLQHIFVCFGEVHYILNNDLDFLAFGDTFLTFLLTSMLTMRLFIPLLKGYREVVRVFFMDFHLIHFKHRGIHYDEVCKIVEEVSHYFTQYVTAMMLVGCILFNLSPLYANYSKGAFSKEKQNITNYEFAVYMSLPFFNPSDHFEAVTAFNFLISYECAVVICVLDLLVILMAFHIIGHVVVLRKNLESIGEPKKTENVQFNRENVTVTVQHKVYSEQENQRISLILKDCVDHHRLIVRFADKMTNFFGVMLAVNYAFQLICLCILLLECTQGDLKTLVRFGPLTLIIFGQLIQISVIFEIIGTVSEKLSDSLYSISWECLDCSNQRSVCFLLSRLQRPIQVTAVGMTPVGVTTMAKILKTTLSYFAFLRSFDE